MDGGNDQEAVLDLDDLDENDDNMFADNSKQIEEAKASEKNDNLIRKVRKYDLSVTYDFYT